MFHEFTINFVNSLWIDHLFHNYTMNSLGVSRIHYRFREFTMNSFSVPRFRCRFHENTINILSASRIHYGLTILNKSRGRWFTVGESVLVGVRPDLGLTLLIWTVIIDIYDFLGFSPTNFRNNWGVENWKFFLALRLISFHRLEKLEFEYFELNQVQICQNIPYVLIGWILTSFDWLLVHLMFCHELSPSKNQTFHGLISCKN